MLPSVLAKQLEKGLGDYLETTFPMTNAPFRGSLRKMIETKDALYHEPFISVRLPFRQAEEMPTCFEAVHSPYLPYVHQQKAFDRLVGNDGRSTLVATGTGSGKTECFLYPILEYCYQHRGEHGIKALLIYPMNALATDQAKRIAEYIYNSPELRGNVTAGMYVGGFDEHPSVGMSEHGVITDRTTMLNSPPDILLTNYKMLDYLLVRPRDSDLWEENRNGETLKYIAVDELHTFDGAQGTDLACLLRRLKSRLSIQPGYLCCIGTSATMGGGDSGDELRRYAAEIFGEIFDSDCVITEDRLTPEEFFAGCAVENYTLPAPEALAELSGCVEQDDPDAYIRASVRAWLGDFPEDPLSPEGRILLGERLMHHSFAQAVITLMGGNYWQETALTEELKTRFGALSELGDGQTVLDALFALISHARIGSPDHLRPFLNVQVQLWTRELRRFLGKVDGENVTYAVSNDLNAQQAKGYLPVVNCRECGTTGWVSVLTERQNAAMYSPEAFYNAYFRFDDKVAMMFPYDEEKGAPRGTMNARLCPDCMQVMTGDGAGELCSRCGQHTIPIYIPQKNTSGSGRHQQYVCPCCGERGSLSMIGLRTATELSAGLSQVFASRFNDDKKTLAFSDNVQDAAHRAGFFNSRTWRFGLRSAIQNYIQDGGAGKTLEEFSDDMIAYWHEKLDRENFVSYFIAPNMTWMKAYENMLEKRSLKGIRDGKKLTEDIEKRIRYEILLEYGMSSRIGRTLEKSDCSCLDFDAEAVSSAAAAVMERARNELGVSRNLDEGVYRQMVIGFLDLLRRNGAFADPVFSAYVKERGKDYLLSNDHLRWLPGVHGGKTAPRFFAVPTGLRDGKLYDFDTCSSRSYTGWIEDCVFASGVALIGSDTPAELNRYILEELIRTGLVIPMETPADFKAYGLNRKMITVSDDVVSFLCEECGSERHIAAENAALWENAPCTRRGCDGILRQSEQSGPDYYGKLYSDGDMARINAREHTGLLERGDREELEINFKRSRDDRMLWDPNVLSCTPTLEMGIDIGDLSTVMLCSMPPAQAQYLQRAGRAGRKDGNALTVAVANARPHDLYYYADPLDMIAGEVTAPKIFLKASAVLERQFVAYCMDCWVKRGVPEDAIPQKISKTLSQLDARPEDMYPFNFLHYVRDHLNSLFASFVQMFAQYLDEAAIEELQTFAKGNGIEESPMDLKVLEAFRSLQKQKKSLQESIASLKEMIKELEDKPQDSSYDDEIKELQAERTALTNVLMQLQDKDVFNFMSDEGLLPNYAFPEAGIILKAVLWRREEDEDVSQRRRYEKKVYEYNRSASSAISEFAPNNSFYVGGKKLTIDQIDMSTAQQARWRLCPNCSHAQLEEVGKNTACCPQCGSPGWADAGQVRNMLKVQMVFSNMDYTKSSIDDESEDRTTVFYTRQLLVDVDEEHDILSAYRMDNEEFAFGYEFVKKATLREINFGEADSVGERLAVAGVEDVRKGFRICKYCGKVQKEGENAIHTKFCKVHKSPELEKEATESFMFLFREFQTEILRLLIPATTMDSTNVKTESFVAAFMLGMKRYFGNVDHLRAAVSEVPVPGEEYRKQYLVIYDSVPGGTGYLKQLMHEENALVEILEMALDVMEKCSCKDDPQKDGCYHCLYAYRQSQKIGDISRTAAIRMLRAILSGKEKIERVGKISSIPVNSILESELENRFITALAAMGNDTRHVHVSSAVVNNKPGFVLLINDTAWEIEPQCDLDETAGIAVRCRPDFILWPVSDQSKLPVAVFTDGFQYHKDIVDDDTLKREAVRQSGRFRVWSLSWRDVQGVLEPQNDFATDVLNPMKMPSGAKLYKPMIEAAKALEIDPSKQSQMELLLKYLTLPDADALFGAHARAVSLSLLQPTLINSQKDYDNWKHSVDSVETQIPSENGVGAFRETAFGAWTPQTDGCCLSVFSGISMKKMSSEKMNAEAAVYAVFDDRTESRTGRYEEDWNGLWHFWNLMQFSTTFICASLDGLQNMRYLALRKESLYTDTMEETAVVDSVWNGILEILFDEEEKNLAHKLIEKQIPAPDDAGCDLTAESGEVLATVEFVWESKKACYLMPEQYAEREKLEKAGWSVLISVEEAEKYFGGES